jgi:hypothetical protein
MPHGGYHGTVELGGNVIQQGYQDSSGDYQVRGGLGDAALNIPVDSTLPSAAEATAAAEAKKKEIQNIFGNQPVDFEQGFVSTGDDDAKARAQRINFQNQQLNNLLIQQAQAEARDRILGGASIPSVDVEQGFGNTGVLRKADLTGFEGGPFGLNIPALGATPSIGMSGIDTLRNPLTGELLFSTDPKNPGSRQDELLKARLGLTTPQYNTFISDLYSANPELYEEKFPLASGNLAQPILARLLEGGLGGVGSGIGSFIDSATGAIFKPRGGTVRPSDGGISDIRADNFGETVPGSIFFKAGSGDVTERNMPLFTQVPDQFREGFLDFYNKYEGPKAGGMAITPVKLPDGSVIEFGDTGSARIFREYLESIGVKIDPDTGQDIKQVESQPTTISNFDVDKFYASLPQYTQQGIMSPNLAQFNQNLRMFPGMA